MMRLLRHRSIGSKLVIVIMSITAVALLVACAGLLAYDQYNACLLYTSDAADE